MTHISSCPLYCSTGAGGIQGGRKMFTFRNAKNLVSRVNQAHYGLDMDQLVVTVQKMTDVMTKILEREADTDGRK